MSVTWLMKQTLDFFVIGKIMAIFSEISPNFDLDLVS